MLEETVGVTLMSGELVVELFVEKLKDGSMSVVGWVDVDPAEVRRKAANFCRLEARRVGEFLMSFETSLSVLLSISLLLVYKLKRQRCLQSNNIIVI